MSNIILNDFINTLKHKIAKKIKDITYDDAIKDYHKINSMDVTLNHRLGNKYVDYFTFIERLNTVSFHGQSYYDFYFDFSFHYFDKKYFKQIFDSLDNSNQNYETKVYHIFTLYMGSINSFSIANTRRILERHNFNCILDPFCGWGGRLAGASQIKSITKYIGIDKNTQNFAGLTALSRETMKLNPNFHSKVHCMDNLDYEHCEFITVDCIFSSPPFYNLEIYSDSELLTTEEWDEYYIKFILKFWNLLPIAGWFIMDIPEHLYRNIFHRVLGCCEEIIEVKKTPTRKNSKETKNTNRFFCWMKRERELGWVV